MSYNSSQLVDTPMPSPNLSPKQVVHLQLEALQENDAKDSGIAISFNFASPGNKAYTGTFKKYRSLFINPLYEPMLNFRAYRDYATETRKNEVQHIVLLTDKKGKKIAYLFALSKQKKAPYQNCWMTDSIMKLDIGRN